jgi:hypothetical protein
MVSSHLLAMEYKKGAIIRKATLKIIIFLLPYLSDNIPLGNITIVAVDPPIKSTRLTLKTEAPKCLINKGIKVLNIFQYMATRMFTINSKLRFLSTDGNITPF